MSDPTPIPIYTLYGETDRFPDVVHSERFSARAPIHNWRISAHRHRHMMQVFLVKDGAIDAIVDSQTIHLTKQYYLFVPASCVHQLEFGPNTSGQVISFPLTLMTSFGPATEDLQSALSDPLHGQIDDALRNLAIALDAAMRSQGTFRAQRLVGLAHSMLALIAEGQVLSAETNKARSDSRLRDLDDLIVQHLSDGWGASEYARALAVTTGHLSRLCRDATGMGAMAYIENRLMAEACRLLAFTQLPVSDIGYRLGYADPSYFSKRFQKSQKCAPTAYRAQFVQ
ncbi:MAG: AraC family transcriptional regulator [Pseudomonadota bacterium]